MKVCLSCNNSFEKVNWLCPSCNYLPSKENGFLLFAPELSFSAHGFEPRYFDQLVSIEEKSFWFRSRNKLLTWVLKNFFPGANNFLEIGCGTGFVLSCIEKAFPNLSLYGSDVFPQGLNYAKTRVKHAALIQMDACKIPFKEEFDVIGAFDLLEHIEKDEIVLQQMYEAVKPKGGIILTVPHHPFLWTKLDEYSRHIRRYTAKDLRDKVKSCGFSIIKTTPFVSILMPLLILSRLKWRKSRVEYGDMTQFNIPFLIDKFFEQILELENFFIKKGMVPPFGSSLLLVACKDK